MINVKGGSTVKKVLLASCVVLGLGSVAPVAAAPIVGTLAFSGTVTVSELMLDWQPTDPFETTRDGVVFTGDGTEYFSGIYNPAGSPPYEATITDLVFPTVVPPVEDFLKEFTSPLLGGRYADLTFDLDGINLPSAALPECTTAFTAFDVSCRLGFFTLTMRETSAGQTEVDVQFDIFGHFEDPTYEGPIALNTATGGFTATLKKIESDTIAEVVAILDRGGSITTTYDAAITATAVPEPATMLTFGLGTTILAAHRRRRAKKNAN